jgi:hypothetical protein
MDVQQGSNVLYSNPQVYEKAQLESDLQTKYGTIATLNSAWGSSYTTFGSTATTISSETIGTGDGTTVTFTHTFAHTVVDPASILILVGGTPQAGDCPWFESYCNRLTTSPNGTIIVVNGNIVSASSQVNYSTGAITLVFSSAPAPGISITASYQYGGWPKALAGGTGLLDEDGTSAWYPSDPGIVTPPTGNQVAQELDAFWGHLAKQYYSTLTSAIRTWAPHHLIMGNDAFIESPTGIRSPTILSQAGAYIDFFFFSQTEPYTTGPSTSVSAYNLTGIPVVAYELLTSSQSPYPGTYATQALRGQAYSNSQKGWWSGGGYVGSDGYGFMVGLEWWAEYDNKGENGNYGIATLNDNLYDGLQDVTTSVVDPLGLTTVPEVANYGDFTDSVKAGNQIWLGP